MMQFTLEASSSMMDPLYATFMSHVANFDFPFWLIVVVFVNDIVLKDEVYRFNYFFQFDNNAMHYCEKIEIKPYIIQILTSDMTLCKDKAINRKW